MAPMKEVKNQFSPRIGLKLWSSNVENYIKEVERLHKSGYFDYIELYVVPNTLHTLKRWRCLNIPFQIHAPHFAHGVNLAEQSQKNYNIGVYEQVKIFSEALSVEYVIIHLGTEGSIGESIRQLKLIRLPSMLVENKPFMMPGSQKLHCRGAIADEILLAMHSLECGFCLDIGHAICTANHLHIDPYNMLETFESLNPLCYHISDNYFDSSVDRHLNFGTGNYNFYNIFKIIQKPLSITIETDKNSQNNLDDFVKDSIFLKGFFV